MRTWEKAEMEELAFGKTAYGKNLNAREANANKHPNNGAGAFLDFDKEPDVTVDELS